MTPFKICSLSDALAGVNPNLPLAIDTETVGKYGTIRLVQFYQQGWSVVKIVEWPQPMELASALTMFNAKLVMQYATYDISTIQQQLGCYWVPDNFADTFLLARLHYPSLNDYTLDTLLNQALGYDPYEKAGINKATMQKSKWADKVMTRQQLEYAATDVFHLLTLYDAVKDEEETTSYRLDMLTLRYMLQFQTYGVPIDGDRREQQYLENTKEIARLNVPINVNSWQQVRPFIGSQESDDLGLAKLAIFGNDRADVVRQARKLIKQNSFLIKYDTEDGRIYGKFAPTARSGRSTCNDDNLQQIPRKLKKIIGYKPEDGKVLLYIDYAQIELRTAAVITGDSTLCNLFRTGVDPHGYVAEMTFGPNFTKENRQVTKSENFNLLYGGGVPMLQSIILKQANMWIEIETLFNLAAKWKRLFPGIVAWQQRGIRNWRNGVLGRTPLGRQYRGNLMTDQLNIENQGFGAEIAKLATHYMYPQLAQYEARLINFVHDAWIIEAPNDPAIYIPLAKMIGDAAKEGWAEAVKCVRIRDIPMPVKVQVGFNWGDIEDGNAFYTYEA